jgi:hypothetical protein
MFEYNRDALSNLHTAHASQLHTLASLLLAVEDNRGAWRLPAPTDQLGT